MLEQGWYYDPFGVHEFRYFSAGWPTSLVRDDGTEGRDEVPDQPPWAPMIGADLVEVPAPPAATSGALLGDYATTLERRSPREYLGHVVRFYLIPAAIGFCVLFLIALAVSPHHLFAYGTGGAAFALVGGLRLSGVHEEQRERDAFNAADWSGDFYPR